MIVSAPRERSLLTVFKSLDIPMANGHEFSVPLDWEWGRKVRIAADLAPTRSKGVRATVMTHNDAFVAAFWRPKARFWHGRALVNDSGWSFFETAEEAWEILSWKIEHVADRTSAETARLREISRERARLRNEQDQRDRAYQERYLASRIVYQPAPDPTHNIDVAAEATAPAPATPCRETWRVGLYNAEGELIEDKHYACKESHHKDGRCARHRESIEIHGYAPPTILTELRMPSEPQRCRCAASGHEHIHLEGPDGDPGIDVALAESVALLCEAGAFTFASCQGGEGEERIEPAYVGVYDVAALPRRVVEQMVGGGFPIVSSDALPSGAACLIGAFDDDPGDAQARRRNDAFRKSLRLAAGEAVAEIRERAALARAEHPAEEHEAEEEEYPDDAETIAAT